MPSNLTQEQLRAKWRAQRALQSGKTPVEADMELLGPEEMDKIRLVVGKKATIRATLSQSQQEETPVLERWAPEPVHIPVASQPASHQGHQEEATKVKAGAGTKRPLNKEERAWSSFYSTQFGPLVVLVLWVSMRDLEKASFYAPNPDEMKLLSPYMARGTNWVFDKLKVPETAVTVIQNSGDYTDFCYIVLGYLHRIGALDAVVPWFSERFEKIREDVQSGRSAEKVVPGGDGVVQAGANGNSAGYDLSTIRGLGSQYAAE